MGCKRSKSGGNDHMFLVWHTGFEVPEGNARGAMSLKV